MSQSQLDKKATTPREKDEKKTPRDRARLMANLQKLGQSRLILARNMWTYTLCLRSVSTYLVRFGEAQGLISSSRDPVLFRSLHPILDQRSLFPIANVKEEQPPASFQQLATSLDAVTSTEARIVKKSLVLPRLQGAEDHLKKIFDKALPKGFAGMEAAAKEPLPPGIKKCDWQLANALFLADLVGKLFSAILPQCTPKSCPEMDIAEEVFYMWKDEILMGGIVLSASEYAQSLFKWVSRKTKEEKIESGLLPHKSHHNEYTTESRHVCTSLFTKMAHIVAHIKYKHIIGEEGGGKTKSLSAITKTGKRHSSRKEEGKSETRIRVTKRSTKGELVAQDEAFADKIKKIQETSHPTRKRTLFSELSSANVPFPLLEMTEFLLREDVEINFLKALELDEKQPNLAGNLVLNYQKGQDLTAFKPEVVLGGVAVFLDQMKAPIILPDYVECFAVALTMPTADIRLACVEKTLLLFRGLAKELLFFVFTFFHSLIEEKKVDSYEICSYFGSKIVRQPEGKVSDSLSTAITHLILNNFTKFFSSDLPTGLPTEEKKKKHSSRHSRVSPRDGMNPARKKKSRGSIDQIGKLLEKREDREEGITELDLAAEEQETGGGSNFGTFVVRDIEVDAVEEPDNNNNNNDNFGTFVMKDVDDNNNNDDNNNFGTFVMKDAGDNDNDDNNNFGTFVMNDSSSSNDNFGTFVVSEGAKSEGPRLTTSLSTPSSTPKKERGAAQAVLENYIQMANPSAETTPRRPYLGVPTRPVAYREPEKWEKNLVSLTKGELEEMEDSAFHRYTKKRAGLQEMQWSTSASTEEKNEEIEKALDGEEAKKIKKFANLWKRTSMMTDVENFSQEFQKNALKMNEMSE